MTTTVTTTTPTSAADSNSSASSNAAPMTTATTPPTTTNTTPTAADSNSSASSNTPVMTTTIERIYVGKIVVLGKGEKGREIKSAIRKSQVTAEEGSTNAKVKVNVMGLQGDEQATKTHAGPNRAVYFYPKEHYQTLKSLLPTRATEFVPVIKSGTNGLDVQSITNRRNIRK